MIYTPLISRIDGDGETGDSQWTGVARIHDGVITGSAVLLTSGLQLLTVAHLVDELTLANAEVEFNTAAGRVTRRIQSVEAYPDTVINSSGVWHDLALVTLEQAAPASAERYALYTGTDEVGQVATIVGYGQAQNSSGVVLPESGAARRAGENSIDTTGAALARFGWQGSLDAQLFYDYDDGSTARDTLGLLLDSPNVGLGQTEAMTTPGDSGGGLFIDQNGAYLLAGINSYTSRWSATDLTAEPDGSVGDLGAATRVSSYTDWIETRTGQLQDPLPRNFAPPSLATVPMQVAEGEGVWFLVQLAPAASQICTVDFFTRDGTAVAGQDYIPTHGTLTMDPGDRWARIWVQTLADDLVEGNETFSLVLADPQGASFPGGVHELTAQRTIVDDPSLTGVTQLAPALWG